jgi:hypothetical protein
MICLHKHILEKWKQPGITSPNYIGCSDANQNSPQARNQSGLTEYNSGYGFHLKYRNPRTLPIESFAHDGGHTLVMLNMVIRRDLQIPTVKEEIRRYSSQYSARLSTHPNDLLVNLMEQPDNNRL